MKASFGNRKRSMALLGLACMVCASARGQSTLAPWYTIQNLAPGIPTAINNAGEIAGYEYTPRPNGVLGAQSSVFRNGAWVLMQELTDPPGAPAGYNTYSRLFGINGLGQAVGYSDRIVLPTFPYDTLDRGVIVGRNETVLSELLLIPPDAFVHAISDGGRIVGSRDQYLDIYPDWDRAFMFDRDAGTLTDLDSLLPGPREDSRAYDVNGTGDVIGDVWLTGRGSRGFFYRESSGSMDVLETADGSYVYWARAINDRRQIAGTGRVNGGTGPYQAVVFDADSGTLSAIESPQGPLTVQSSADDINSQGDVVGYFNHDGLHDRAFLYRSGTLYDLNDLIPPGSGWVLRDAVSINDGGQIVGRGELPGQPYTIAYFLLTPSTPQQVAGGLIDAIKKLQTDGVLNAGNANALIAKVTNAIKSIDGGNAAAAVNQLQAFISQVEAFIAAGKLTAAEGEPLIDIASWIIAGLTR